MEKNGIELYENKGWDHEVSPYGLQNGYLDYYFKCYMLLEEVYMANDWIYENLK